MIDKSVFFIWVIWYFYTYGIPPILFNFMIRFNYLYDDVFKKYNKIIHPCYCDENKQSEEKIKSNVIEIIDEKIKEPPKYEDKYLQDIRRFNKEWVFTEEEDNLIPTLIDDFYNGYINIRKDRVEEITKKIIDLEKEIAEDVDTVNYIENEDEDGDQLILENTLEERNSYRRFSIQKLQEEYNIIKLEIESDEGISSLKNQSIEEANQYIINGRLDKLKNCYVIEKTPIGNVLMIYEKDRESFKYYSDCNIPYRYLEVIGRKYVKLF